MRANGVHATESTRKRGPARRALAPTPDAPKLADFAVVETPPMDAQMWPVHAVAWLQPALSAAAPQSSGLRPERRHRVPVPDFVPFVTTTSSSARHIEQCEPLPAARPQSIPRCDLAPLGWDPRREVLK